MPRIIPVLDVLGGRAVHARGGRRADYRPLRSRWRAGSDPTAIAGAVRDAFGIAEVYLADLDALAGAAPDLELFRRLSRLGLATWVDAGLRDDGAVEGLLEAGVARVVAGLETLGGPEALGRIVAEAGPERVVFSLDLRDGWPVVAPGADWRDDTPGGIARVAIGEGVRTILLLDVAHVGMDRGVGTLGLLGALAAAFPSLEWIAGGGVRGPGDVRALGDAGASAVLVGSAIHDGRLGPGSS